MNPTQRKRVVGTLVLILGAAIVTAPSSLQAARCPEPNIPVTLKFRDAPGDAVRSDGRPDGTYFDLAEIGGCGGGLGVVFFGPFNFELEALAGTRSANGNVVFEVEINNGFEGKDGLLGIEPGTSVWTTKVQFNFVVDTRRYFLAYWEDRYPQPDSYDITVTRFDENTWFIEALPSELAKLRSQKAKGAPSGDVIDHGSPSAPFHLTITKQASQ